MVVATLLAVPAASAATSQPTVSLSPNTLPTNSSSTTKITVQVNGLTPGATVRIDRYRNPSGDGLVDSGAVLVQSFLVTDGVVAKFGGVIDPKIPGDVDGLVDGNISAQFSIPSQPMLGQLAGTYVIQVTSPTNDFTPVMASSTLTFTQPTYTQTISGQVSNGSVKVANAPVVLLNPSNDGGFITGVLTDANGNYSIGVAPGSYGLFAAAPGLLGPGSPVLPPAVVSGVSQTGQNINLTPATNTITSATQDISGSPALPAIGLFLQSKNANLLAFAISDINGNVVVPVTSASDWSVQVDENSLSNKGYVPLQNTPTVDTTGGSISPGALQFTPANAMIYGTLNDSNGNAIPGADIYDQDSQSIYQDDFTSNSTGNFFLLALGTTSGSGTAWQVGANDKSTVLAGYVIPNSVNVTVSAGIAYPVALVATLSTTFLTGTVTENGCPQSGIKLDVQPQNGGSNLSATTDSNGQFSFAVSAGTWEITLDSDSATSGNLVGPQLTETVATGNTIANINYAVLPATATVSGTAKDANGNPLSSNDNVNAFATINNVMYNLSVNLNNSGDYSFPLIAGSWTFEVSGQNGSIAGFQPTTVTISGSQTLNLAPVVATAFFQGTVTNNGNPVTGVTMDATMQNNSNNNEEFQATTSNTGSFNLGVVAGTWIIQMDATSASQNNLVVPQLTETISTGNTLSNLTYPVLTATAIVNGTVTDAKGNPLPSSDNVYATATINNLTYQASVNLSNSGNYSLPLVNGTWTFTIYGNNGQVATIPSVTVTVSGSRTLNLAPLVATAFFTGTVTNNGTPVSGITVDATLTNSNTIIQAVTTSTGSFNLGVVAGTWSVFVDGNSASQNQLVTPASLIILPIATSQTIPGLSIPVLTSNATVSGTVKDGGGNPLSSSFNVSATGTFNNLQYDANTQVSSNGTYSLPLINGSWEFQVFGPNGATANIQSTTYSVTTGNQTINLAPPAATATFAGTVTNNGAPVAGLTVDAQQQNGSGFFQATTALNGSFILGVSAGTWNLYLDSPGVTQANLVASNLGNETITTGQTLSGLAFPILSATGSINGTISDYNGNLVGNNTVNLNGSATINGVNYVSSVLTNSSGGYSLPVVNGTWSVQPGGNSLNYNSQTATVNGSSTLNFVASAISSQPQSQTITAGQNTSFGVGTNAPGTPAFQWQISTNGGTNWTPLSDTGPYVGSATNQLFVNNAPTTLNNAQYECVVSFTYNSSPVTETTSAVTLTVGKTPAGVGFGVLIQSYNGVGLGASAQTNPLGLGLNITYNGSLTLPTLPGSYTVVATINDPNYTGSVSSTFTILSDFAYYQSVYFPTQLTNPNVSGTFANPANDGMPNILKYALGLDPTKVDAAAGTPVVGQANGSMTLTYVIPPGLPDITYVVQVSSDLQNWTSGNGATQVLSTTVLDGQHTQVVVQDLTPLSGNSPRFIRLVVTQGTGSSGGQHVTLRAAPATDGK